MITVEISSDTPLSERPLEVVERKGKGHPDSICDAVMDAVSVALCREYLSSFGAVLHHNVDKGLLAAGSVEKRFGDGRVVRPMELFIGDRATFEAGGRKVPVAEIAEGAARGWFRENLPYVDAEADLVCRPVLSPGSAELTDIFSRPGEVLAANDTSAAVGWWPLSVTERAVLETERHLNGTKFKAGFPDTGEDVKVMGLRRGGSLSLTVAMPLRAPAIRSEREYFERKEWVLKEISSFLERFPFDSAEVSLNALDVAGRGEAGTYLTLLGTSAEDADSGQVGRGNRVNGLISLCRPLGTEAAAGKNPVSHVGKIYNFLAHATARKIWEEVPGIREATVFLLSRIGSPIDRPQLASVRLLPEAGADNQELEKRSREVMAREVAGISTLCAELAAGRHPVC
jgi:S-adenosylmethionine synthetase